MVANSIINLALGLSLGVIAVTAAPAFGSGDAKLPGVNWRSLSRVPVLAPCLSRPLQQLLPGR